jgi:hypothetical protein
MSSLSTRSTTTPTSSTTTTPTSSTSEISPYKAFHENSYASPLMRDWMECSDKKNLDSLAQLAFPEIFELAWGFDLQLSEEEASTMIHKSPTLSPTLQQKQRSESKILKPMARKKSSLSPLYRTKTVECATPPLDIFDSPSSDSKHDGGSSNVPFSYFDGNYGGGGSSCSSSSNDHEYSSLNSPLSGELEKYWAILEYEKEESRLSTPSKRPRNTERNQLPENLSTLSPAKNVKFRLTTTKAKKVKKIKKGKNGKNDGKNGSVLTTGALYERNRRSKKKQYLTCIVNMLKLKKNSTAICVLR